MIVEFRDIDGVEGPYEISNNGDIRNKITGYIYKLSVSEWGYAYKTFQSKYGKGYVYVHKAVAEAFIPNPEGKPKVNHKDGNKLNNNSENLEWVTNRENIQHAFRIGLSKPTKLYGEKHGMCKISDSQVLEIKKLREEGMLYKDIAEIYRCHLSNIAYICSGKTRSKTT